MHRPIAVAARRLVGDLGAVAHTAFLPLETRFPATAHFPRIDYASQIFKSHFRIGATLNFFVFASSIASKTCRIVVVASIKCNKKPV